MIGDLPDFIRRLKSTMPASWWGDATPVLDGVLNGFAAIWSWLFGLLQSVRLQARIATASGEWLDRVAADFFGQRLRRNSGESDAALRARILMELARERATRAGLQAKLTSLTGAAPSIIEPSRAPDIGGWGCGLGWGNGAWGSLAMPNQCFVTVTRTAGCASDSDLYAAAAEVAPVGAIVWMRLVG